MREFVYTSADIHLGQLRFDPENPRLPLGIDASNLDAVLEFMLDDAGLVDLASSIAAQGYFPGEPLLCCPVPELESTEKPPPPSGDSQYVVVEGNRRFAAVTLLANPSLAPRRKRAIAELAQAGGPDRLPAIIFPRRDDVLDYLGYRHITGIKEWDPLAKARYLRQVRDRKVALDEPATPRELARMIGSNGPYVARMLTALAAWERLEALGFFQEHEINSDDLPFAVFSTALNYDQIPDWLNVDPGDDSSVAQVADTNLRRLATWFFVSDERVPKNRPLLRESRNIRYVNAIVGNEEAMASLEEANTPALAASLTAEAREVFTNALVESDRYLAIAERRFENVDTPSGDDPKTLRSIDDRVGRLIGEVESRLGTS